MSGYVTSSAGAAALVGAEISLDRYDDDVPVLFDSRKTSSDGNYMFATLPNGVYRLRVNSSVATGGSSAAGYVDQTQDKITISTTTPSRTFSFGLTPASGVTGKIVDAKNGKVIEGAVISAVNAQANAEPVEDWSDVDGKFAFTKIPSGSTSKICVTVYGEGDVDASTGYVRLCRNVPSTGLALTPGKVLNLGTLSMEPAAAINGTVDLDYAEGARMLAFDAERHVLDTTDSLKRDETRRYKLSALPATTVYVCLKSLDANYASKCYDGSAAGVPWDGDPASLDFAVLQPITTELGDVVSASVDFRLSK